MRKSWLVWLLVTPLVACADRNDVCQWPPEEPRPLDLQAPADGRHLRADIELAEDLSIRYGDVRWGPGADRARGRDERCLTPLLAQIARLHTVSLDEVVSAREDLIHKGPNLAVNVPVTGFYALILWMAIRRIHTRFSLRDELAAVVVASVLTAVLVGALTVAFGHLWEAVVEMIRIGNGHLSYRGLRRQWLRFALEFFMAATIVSWCVSLAHCWWIARRNQPVASRRPLA